MFGVLTIAFGSWKDALFLGILVSNIAIGSFQEIRSKRALDRLADRSAPDEEQASRKKRLLQGPKEFREMRAKSRKPRGP